MTTVWLLLLLLTLVLNSAASNVNGAGTVSN